MIERKKIAGGDGETGAEAWGLGLGKREGGNLPPQSRPVDFSSRLYFSSFPLSESLEHTKSTWAVSMSEKAVSIRTIPGMSLSECVREINNS